MRKSGFASLIGFAVLAIVLLPGAVSASAAPPLTDISTFVVDPEQATDMDAAIEAVNRVAEQTNFELNVVVVDSFDGMQGDEWALKSAQWSNLDPANQILFAVALDDLAVGSAAAKSIPETIEAAEAYANDALQKRADVDEAIASYADVVVKKVNDEASSNDSIYNDDSSTFFGADDSSQEGFELTSMSLAWIVIICFFTGAIITFFLD